MDANGATFLYNGTQYVPFIEPSTVEMATEMAADYFGKTVTAFTSASNYINGVVAPYVAPVSSKIAELQTALPEAVSSALGKEVAIEGVGSTTVGTIAALAGPTVLPIVNYFRNSWNRSSELSNLQAENNKVLLDALAKSDRDIDGAIETADAQIAKTNLLVRKHKQDAKDSFFSFKNMLKHTVTVLAPFCVLPQVGFAVAGTAALVGLTTRAVTHVLNYRGEASQATEEHKSTASLRQLRNRLQELKDTHEEKVAIDEAAQLQADALANSADLIERQTARIARNDAEIQRLRNLPRPPHVAIPIDDDDDAPLDL
ncbi:hypothetical protein [Endozoicomonas arenosclerae]|uniref:hypothetical protein n=1 Tax=Endozoicomonas arenosclerae TaxID=1633495 RepID=UPI000A8C378B|nr:hypothetical protein [Endozoicomonas arenosclerae]